MSRPKRFATTCLALDYHVDRVCRFDGGRQLVVESRPAGRRQDGMGRRDRAGSELMSTQGFLSLRSPALRFGAALVVAIALIGCSSGDDSQADVTEESSVATESASQSDDGGDVETTSTNDESPTPADVDDAAEQSSTDESPTTTVPQDDGEAGAPPIEPVAPADLNLGPIVTSEIEEEADFGTGVTASIVYVEAVDVIGRFPGERSGPGVVLTVEVANGSPEPISLDFVTVDLIKADGASAIPVQLEGEREFFGQLRPGESAVALYQYFIPVEHRASAFITVSYASSVPTALFTGDLPDV